MSKATLTLMDEIRKLRKSRSPEDAKFMRFFGATDAYLKCSEGVDRASSVPFDPGFNSCLQIPLSSPIPLDFGFGLPWVAPVRRHTSEVVQAPVVPSGERHLVPAPSSHSGHNEAFDHALRAEQLRELLTFLADSGLKASKVRALPSGAMKITVDDLKMASQVRKPEFVELGR